MQMEQDEGGFILVIGVGGHLAVDPKVEEFIEMTWLGQTRLDMPRMESHCKTADGSMTRLQ